jgi:hypothetical protein
MREGKSMSKPKICQACHSTKVCAVCLTRMDGTNSCGARVPYRGGICCERCCHPICSAAGYALRLEAEKKHQDFIHNVIDSIKMLAGWDIVSLDRWKHGVVKYTAERTLHGMRERQIGYAKDEVFESLQLPPNE